MVARERLEITDSSIDIISRYEENSKKKKFDWYGWLVVLCQIMPSACLVCQLKFVAWLKPLASRVFGASFSFFFGFCMHYIQTNINQFAIIVLCQKQYFFFLYFCHYLFAIQFFLSTVPICKFCLQISL